MSREQGNLFERYIRGWVKVTAKGGALYRFINAIRSSGIICRRQQCKGDMLCFILRRCDREKAEILAEEYGVTLEMQVQPSLPAWLFRYRLRIGIPIGMILGAALLIYTSNVVMVIEFQGNRNVTDKELLAALEDCDVERGTFIGDVDFYRSELYLRHCFDEIAWVGMRHTGNRLVVEVMETELKPQMVEDRVPCHIIADRTAQITGVNVSRGQLMHIVGEAVKEGEVLVSGIQADEYGHMTFRHAIAEIQGVYEEEQTFFCASMQPVRAYTGNVIENRTLDFLSLRLPLSHNDCPYSDYNKTIEITPMTLFGAELPIHLERTKQMEYAVTEQILTPDEMRQNLQEQQERYEANFLTDCEIIQKKTHYTKKETAMVLTVSYVLEGEIGLEQELLLKDDRKPYVASRRRNP